MKKNSVIYGLATGLIVSFGMLVWWALPSQRERIYEMGVSMMFVLGMMNMILGFMSIVILHKRMRNEKDGPVDFMSLFKPALGITLVATVIYVSVWMLVYSNGGQELMEVLNEGRITKIEESGFSEELKASKIANYQEFSDSYQDNAVFRAGMTILEVFPVGLVFAVVSSFVFHRKKQRYMPL